MSKLISISIEQDDFNLPTPEVLQEQNIAIYDLEQTNFFQLVGFEAYDEIKLNILPWIEKYNPKISTEINSRFKMAKNITKNMYDDAVNLRKEIISELDQNLPVESILIFPTTPFSAPIRGQSDDDLSELRKKVMEFTCIGGLSSRPQISIPKFKSSTGPIGLSVLGNKNSDEIILNNLNLF